MSRQFSEEQARDIFARAAERQHATESTAEGLTLDELQEIGRAAGLDPEHVAAAAAETSRQPVESVVIAGVDTTPRASRLMAGEMTDPVWEQVVARLRRTFGGQGIATDLGRVREWTSGAGSNLVLTAEPAPGGTLVTISSSREPEGRAAATVPMYGGGAAVAMAAFLLAGNFPTHYPWLISGLILAAMLVMALGIRQSLASWSAKRQSQFDGLMDQVELLTRDAAPVSSSARPEPPVGRLGDLDALGPETTATGPRGRVRE